jgi:hypothetical protein
MKVFLEESSERRLFSMDKDNDDNEEMVSPLLLRTWCRMEKYEMLALVDLDNNRRSIAR